MEEDTEKKCHKRYLKEESLMKKPGRTVLPRAGKQPQQQAPTRVLKQNVKNNFCLLTKGMNSLFFGADSGEATVRGTGKGEKPAAKGGGFLFVYQEWKFSKNLLG